MAFKNTFRKMPESFLNSIQAGGQIYCEIILNSPYSLYNTNKIRIFVN